MSRFRKLYLALAAALSLAATIARGAVDIGDVNVTNVGTTSFTVVWTTSEVSTPALEIFSDSGGTNAVTASCGLNYFPIAEGDVAVVNDAAARAGRRALELLAINRRVVVVRVTGLTPGTNYYVRPRTFGAGVDNGTAPVPLKTVTTALFTSMVVDGRLLRVRFPNFAGEGMVALVQGPAGTTPLSAIIGDSAAADSALFPLSGLLDTAGGTNALFNSTQPIVIRILGAGAPTGNFTQNVDFAAAYKVAKLEAIDATITSPAPFFAAHPANRTDQAGSNATFNASASGTPMPTYKWQRLLAAGGNWVDLADDVTFGGTTTGTLLVRSVTLAMTGDQFRCVATNGVPPDATSNAATLTVTSAPVVNTAPAITTPPTSVAVNANGNATFAVVATGVPTPTYQWQKGGTDIPGATNPSLALANVTLADAGNYRVVVTNIVSSVNSTPVALTIYVAPSISAQPLPQTVFAGQSATFGVTASGTPDPKFQWKRNGVNLLGATTPSLQLTNLTIADDAAITVEVSNAAPGGLGGTVTSSPAALVVNPAAPVFVSTPPLAVTAVQGLNFLYGPVTINPTAAVFSATGLPPGLSVDPANGNISGIPLVVGALPASFSIVLTVENPPPKVMGSDSRTITLTVNPTPPHLTSPVAASGQVNAAFTYTIVADNGATSFGASSLPPGLTFNAVNGAITGTPTQAGSFTATISATNAGGTTSQSLVITIAPAPSAPVYSGNINPSGTQGTLFSFVPVFSGSPTSYSLTAGTLPLGLSLNPATGAITGTPLAVGTFAVTLQATNLGGPTGVDLQITINPAPAAPVITSANSVSTTVGAVFSFTLTAQGVPSVYTFAASNLPGWLSLNPSTGVLSGTPVLGTYTLQVHATNSPAPATFMQGPDAVLMINVGPSPNAPVINSAAVVQGRVGVALNFQLTSNPPASSFGITSASPPAWLILNSANGAISGTPTVAGPVRVVFAATDLIFGQGLGVEVLFDIAPALLAPVITSGGTIQGQVGQPFRYAITATNGPLTSFAMPTGTLPPGLSFDPALGVISGIPSTATTRSIAVTLTASNAAGASDAKTLEISILPPAAAPVIMSPLRASGRVGLAFSYQIVASENPTSYLVTGLPTGLTFDPTSGLISGTPTRAGEYEITLRAANARGPGAPSELELTVLSALGAPRIVSLPAAVGQVGDEFSYTIIADPGPILNYNLTGSLPLGLALNTSTGIISGRPSSAGLFLVSLTATNSTGTGLPQPLLVYVKPAIGVPIITSSMYDFATVGAPYSYVISATNMPGTRPLVPPNALDAVNLPPGLAVNPSQGVIEGTPTTVGTYAVSLVGTNAAGTGDVRDLRIIVRPPSGAPTITSSPTAAGRVGSPFTYTITATNSPRVFEVRDAPRWMTVNSESGLIAGTPTVPGDFEVRLLARNGTGISDAMTLTISISPSGGTPVITSSRTAFGRVGTAFAYTITAAPAASSFVAVGLPAGLAINGSTGAITGIPSVSGTFNVTLTASNAQGAGTPTKLKIEVQAALRLVPRP